MVSGTVREGRGDRWELFDHLVMKERKEIMAKIEYKRDRQTETKTVICKQTDRQTGN